MDDVQPGALDLARGLLDGGALNRIILYVTSLMEVKSSMGVIVAAPTAGACAALPGAVIAMAESMNLDEEAMAKAKADSSLDVLAVIGAHDFQGREHAWPKDEVGMSRASEVPVPPPRLRG